MSLTRYIQLEKISDRDEERDVQIEIKVQCIYKSAGRTVMTVVLYERAGMKLTKFIVGADTFVLYR